MGPGASIPIQETGRESQEPKRQDGGSESMGLRGTDPFVEQVRLATDILSVISPYLELRKAGKRWKGLCPFHGEKTPSFFVNQENQTFYCFGCHQGGDAFAFLMAQEKMTFPEALHALAERAGIPIPQRRLPGTGGPDERLGEAMEVAAAFFRDRLRSREGSPAKAYLNARGIDDGLIERFGLGWAPASWDALLQHAGRLLPERILLRAGLEIEGERGLYDRFRERVMIPIRTAGGRTVAFGGRLLGAGEPKYLNSPETPLYRKGTVLYGLPEARDAIREAGNVLVVEGYFDVISLSAAGIGWVVGTCGTAMTPDQASLLRRYAERWTLLFDGDAAGRAAVLRAIDAAVPVHPGVRVGLCPEGLDPDAWVRSKGAGGVREALGQTATPLQHLEGWARAQGLSPESTLPRVADLLRKVSDPLVRDLWVQEAAGRFRIREARIWEVIGRPEAQARGSTQTAGPQKLAARERQIIAAAVRTPQIARDLKEACDEVPDIAPGCRDLLAWIAARCGEGIVDEAGLLSRATEEEERIRELSFLHDEIRQVEEVPHDILHRIRRWGLQHRMRELTDRIRIAEERGEEVANLLVVKQELAAALRDADPRAAPKEGNFP
jgi:DNA primase